MSHRVESNAVPSIAHRTHRGPSARFPTLRMLLLLGPLLLVSPAARGETAVNVDRLTVDGQEVRKLRCKLSEGGLFATMTVVGAVAQQKKALDACAPAGAAFRVEWKWKGGKASDVKVTSASAADASSCVVAAMARTHAGDNGSCSAIVLVGDAKGAGRAAGALR